MNCTLENDLIAENLGQEMYKCSSVPIFMVSHKINLYLAQRRLILYNFKNHFNVRKTLSKVCLVAL